MSFRVKLLLGMLFASIPALVCSLPAIAAPPSLQMSCTDKGLVSLKYGGTEYLADGNPVVRQISMTRADGTIENADLHLTSKIVYSNRKQVVTSALWGYITYSYAVEGNQLNLKVTVTNNSNTPITAVKVTPLELLYPGRATITGNRQESIGSPGIIGIQGAAASIAVCNEEFNKPLYFALLENPNKPGGGVSSFTLNLQTGGENKLILDQITRARPIAAGASDTYTFSIRFAQPGTPALSLAKDLLTRYAKERPMLLKWPDRRPILRTFMGGGLPEQQVLANEQNPLHKVLPTEVSASFRQNTVNKIKTLIEAAKAVDAQGVIIWDLEGDTFAHPTTYIGDPRNMQWLNPEMDLLADELFKMIKDAGLKSGVCIRPSRVYYDATTNMVKHSFGMAKEPFPELDAKIDYCSKRWGCELFYIDTNVFYRPYPWSNEWENSFVRADVYQQLLLKYPNVLLIPEVGTNYLDCYAYAAMYGEADMGDWDTAALIRAVYPDSFRIIVIEDANPFINHDRFVNAVRHKNVLMTFGLGATGWNVPAMRRIYQEAKILDAGIPKQLAKATQIQLLAALQDKDVRMRYYAAVGLANNTSANSIDALTKLVANTAEEWIIRKRALVSVTDAKVTSNIPLYVDISADNATGLYAFAWNALAAIGQPATQPLIARLTKEVTAAQPDFGTISLLDQAIVKVADPQAAAPLRDLFGKVAEKETRICGDLLLTIGKLPDAESIPFLKAIFTKGDAQQIAAAEALCASKDVTAVQFVKDAIAQAKKDGNQDLVDQLNQAVNRAQ